jgi:hypothetical protein
MSDQRVLSGAASPVEFAASNTGKTLFGLSHLLWERASLFGIQE